MIAKKLAGDKALITDLDGPVGNCQKAADEIGIGEIYRECRNNPEPLQDELDDLSEEFFEISKRLVEGFELNPGVYETLRDMKKSQYDTFGCTDNPIFGIRGNNFKDRFKEGELCYLDEVHPTTIPKLDDDGKIYLETNGGKASYVREKFNEYEQGILVVEDKNDLEAAEEAERLKKNHDITILHYGENCEELDEFSDYQIKKFSEILNYT